MKELFGEMIRFIYIDEARKYLAFINFAHFFVYKVQGFHDYHKIGFNINNPENIIDRVIVGIEQKESFEEEMSDNEETITTNRCTLKTDKGYADIEYWQNDRAKYGPEYSFISNVKLIFPEFKDKKIAYPYQYTLKQRLPITMTLGDSKEEIKLYPYGETPNKKEQ